MVLDKTGTLTRGEPSVTAVMLLATIADLVKIDRVQAEVLLEQKTSEIRRLQNEG